MSKSRLFRVGIDIGGTFTDIVLSGSDGSLHTKKTSSTPEDYGEGIIHGLEEMFTEHGIFPAEIDYLVHATTVATNAVLEDKGAKTGLITTEGFRDVLEFRRIRIPELFNLDYIKPKPLIQRRYRLEVKERLGPDGTVRIPLDESTVIAAAEQLRMAKVESVAICLLHSYANPDHELRVAELIGKILPSSVFISCSSEILPEIREYERTSTTVVNAFLGPVVRRYLDSLTNRLQSAGIKRPLHIMQSSGGQMSVDTAVIKPAYLVESGPAAGVIAAARIAKQAGLSNVITLDMGGTTTKTALVENGEPAKTNEYEIGAGINLSSKLVKGAGYAIKLPFIDVSEIGAGGGSIVWVNKGGLLQVGPQSAASVPGPVCYGKGGEQVTITDALLVLGYINPDYLVGGSLKLDPEKARRAIKEQVCPHLDKSLLEAAFGVFTIAVANMVRAVKAVSTYRGRDPRDYTLIAFGGNGPVVALAIAQELAMNQVLIPPNPGVLSAYGLIVSDAEHEFVKSFPGNIKDLNSEDIYKGLLKLIDEALTLFKKEGYDPAKTEIYRYADIRYRGQAYELTVPVSGQGLPNLETMTAAFHEEHLRTYAHKSELDPVEMVNIRVVARISLEGSSDSKQPSLTKSKNVNFGTNTERMAYFGSSIGLISTPVLSRSDLLGKIFRGPLILEEYDSTCLVPPGFKVSVDDFANMTISSDI